LPGAVAAGRLARGGFDSITASTLRSSARRRALPSDFRSRGAGAFMRW
jgi:hypothetical protein